MLAEEIALSISSAVYAVRMWSGEAGDADDEVEVEAEPDPWR